MCAGKTACLEGRPVADSRRTFVFGICPCCLHVVRGRCVQGPMQVPATGDLVLCAWCYSVLELGPAGLRALDDDAMNADLLTQVETLRRKIGGPAQADG
jgi:hypothetical protein